MYSYIYYARRKLGVQLSLVASVMYNVKTDGMSSSRRTIESFMRAPKYFGIFMVIMGPIIAFNPG